MLGLRGAGILGLLVGGTGIANTMQVLLRRRQREVAIWKALGYHEGDLRLIFSLEAGLLGLCGSLLGAGLGALISSGLLDVFRRTSSLLYQWTFSPAQPLMGILIGTLATVIFAFWAIAITSQARPMALLRNEPVDIQSLPGCQFIVLGLILAAPFTALAGVVMESVIAGIGMLLFIAIGIAVLGGRLYILPVAMAGLALLAGLLLVANSVSLAMLDRRYEIGILKTIGYSRRQIVAIFALEYGLAGLLATGAGVLAMEGFLAVLAIAAHLPVVALLPTPLSLLLIAFCGVGLTLLTVFGVALESTRVSPVVVLNERN